MSNIRKTHETMGKWLHEVSENNDHELAQTKKLKIILFNLKIVCADKPEVTPIASELANIINEMHISTQNLVTTGREELRQAFKEFGEYIEEMEGVKLDEN
jgi:hypothetical protein